MKAEYAEATSTAMFPKLHHQRPQKFPVQPLPHSHRTLPPPHFHPTSDDDESLNSAAAIAVVTSPPSVSVSARKAARTPDSGDGSTIEVSRRPRGRPPGSKNKPKPPVIITRDSEPAMSPYILEVPGGVDVVDAVTRFSRRRNVGLCVLTGSGTVANVTLRQPSATPGATVTFHGRFDILSLSAALLPLMTSSSSHLHSAAFTISLAGPQGQIVGGMVSGQLLAAGTVYVIAASFDSPSYHRLPAESGDAGGISVSGNEEQSLSPAAAGSGDGSGSGGHPPVVEMSMYSGGHQQLQSDVMWAPGGGARQQQPPY